MFATPVEAFRAAVDALDRSQWLAAASTCDPMSLAGFRRQLVEQFRRAEPEHVMTIEAYMRFQPEMPREVAEYLYAQYRRAADPGRRFQEELPGLASIEDLERLTPVEVFAAWLDGRSPRRQVARQLADRGIDTATAAASLEEVSPFGNFEPIGSLPDGEGVAHVLYRHGSYRKEEGAADSEEWLAGMSPEERELALALAGRSHPMVTTCRQQPDGSWRLLAGYDFLQTGSFGVEISAEPPA